MASRAGGEPSGSVQATTTNFLAVQALDLDPQAAIGGGIGRVGALGNDALERQAAGLLIEHAPAPGLVVAVVPPVFRNAPVWSAR
jgi:hypothetical protein